MRKFELGKVVATPGALEMIEAAGQEPDFFLAKHCAGDWGSTEVEDAKANDEAVNTGGRIMSIYRTLLGNEVWVLTDAEDDAGCRAATTILLPDEY